MTPLVQTLKGFRDFLPAEKRTRDFVVAKVKQTFELYGFEPLETPTLEYADLLLGKYGTEADKLVFTFTDRGGREVGLRYDQTVPTARVLVQYQNDLPAYFRRYQIQNNFRAEKPQAGRYREFTQCDIDIFGSKAPLADAEIIACTYAAFKNVGYPAIKLAINDRQVLSEVLTPLATDQVSVLSIIQSLDKLNKLTETAVIDELVVKGLSDASANQAIQSIKSATPTANLTAIFNLITELGVPETDFSFDPTIARGLDYYTGMIFEVQLPLEDLAIGSFGGGGRYDHLIKQLGGPDLPAVGIAFGLDRMVEAALKLNLIPASGNPTPVLVTIFDQTLASASLQLAQSLRDQAIATEVYPAYDRLEKQFKVANQKGIPFVLVIGPDEAAKNLVTLKNMQTGEQTTDTLENLLPRLSPPG
ncbi:histidine--tRNA ligase [Microgenomates group bacterium RBG_16_45_19]|nr:MAG: histidine--tRNA ligase [Microgenomates group bacterium RBG_16_45_19]